MNRYAYTRNNPVRYSDPTGHDICNEDGYCFGQNGKYRSRARDKRSEYSDWELKILGKLLNDGGEEGHQVANYIMKKRIHIKVGEAMQYYDAPEFVGYWTGDWQSAFAVGAWYEDNGSGTDWVVLNPNSEFEKDKDPGLRGIAMIAHEALHLEQGPSLRNSVFGEWQAYQFGVRVKLNMGGSMSPHEAAVMRQTTVEGYYDEVQNQYPGYMIQLLPMFPQENLLDRVRNSCLFGCP